MNALNKIIRIIETPHKCQRLASALWPIPLIVMCVVIPFVVKKTWNEHKNRGER